MPSRDSSSSPEIRTKKKKSSHESHKRHRSRSPRERHEKHRSQRRSSHSPDRYHKHGRDRHGNTNTRVKEEKTDDRYERHAVKSEPRDRGYERHAVKSEPRDRGYERQRRDNRDEQRHQRHERDKNDDKRRQHRQERGEGNPFTVKSEGDSSYGRPEHEAAAAESSVPKEEPNFALSGKLTEETNTYKGVVIKYNQPEEARKPKTRWRLYPFKDGESLPVLHIHRMSAYLLGRDRKIVDIPVDHPSCSKQHAVLQYRLVPYEREDMTTGLRVKPYIIDLGSSNGTYLNNQRIDPQRYVELKEQDMLKFGFSSREYVLLHDRSDTSAVNDDEGED